MEHILLKALATFVIIQWAAPKVLSVDTAYSSHPYSNHTLQLVVNSRMEVDGDWVTIFNASEYGSLVNNITLDLTQSTYRCGAHEAVRLAGFIRATTNQDSGPLHFHSKCGRNAAISHDGKSVQKIKLDEHVNTITFTNRPLRRNELLEVRIDKKLKNESHCFGIGVTSYNPESISIPNHMNSLKSGNWMLFHARLHTNTIVTLDNYGKNLDNLKEGDRAGVMVNNYGVLHFFVNGEDQGPAASNMPSILYGVVELLLNVAKMTIVDTSP